MILELVPIVVAATLLAQYAVCATGSASGVQNRVRKSPSCARNRISEREAS